MVPIAMLVMMMKPVIMIAVRRVGMMVTWGVQQRLYSIEGTNSITKKLTR
jgi:hypothetical protein